MCCNSKTNQVATTDLSKSLPATVTVYTVCLTTGSTRKKYMALLRTAALSHAGWPTDDDTGTFYANPTYACAYNNYVVQ